MTMNNAMKKKDAERLHEWINRIARQCVGMDAEEIKEVLTEVSKTSYTEGVHVTMKPYYGG
jgi:hypothetical protein